MKTLSSLTYSKDFNFGSTTLTKVPHPWKDTYKFRFDSNAKIYDWKVTILFLNRCILMQKFQKSGKIEVKIGKNRQKLVTEEHKNEINGPFSTKITF